MVKQDVSFTFPEIQELLRSARKRSAKENIQMLCTRLGLRDVSEITKLIGKFTLIDSDKPSIDLEAKELPEVALYLYVLVHTQEVFACWIDDQNSSVTGWVFSDVVEAQRSLARDIFAEEIYSRGHHVLINSPFFSVTLWQPEDMSSSSATGARLQGLMC